MTTLTAFKPPPNNSFSFQPTLDGETCNVIVWWNVDGQRWYVSASLPDGTQLFNLPLIGSPGAVSLQALNWSNGAAQGQTDSPHGHAFLSTVKLTIADCLPDAYNGTFPCFIVGKDKFSYPIPGDPGAVTQLGTVSYDFNIGAGYLKSSTLVFRESTQMFEVTP